MVGKESVDERSYTRSNGAGEPVEQFIKKLDSEQRKGDYDHTGPCVALTEKLVQERGDHRLNRELATEVTRLAGPSATHPLHLWVKQLKTVPVEIACHHKRLRLPPIVVVPCRICNVVSAKAKRQKNDQPKPVIAPQPP